MKICSLLQGMLWNGVENGMEWKDDFGMECGRCSEWNGMEDLKNGMEDGLSCFRINYIKYIQTYNKLQSVAKDTAYQYE